MRYISNELAESERDALRARLLTDAELSDSFAEWETEAIDSLAKGRLGPAEAAAMEDYLRATRQQSRVAVATALSTQRRAKAVSPYAYGLAVAALLLLCFPLFRLSRGQRAVAPAVIASVPLLPGSLRGEGAVQQVRKQTGRIALQLQYLDAVPSGECRVEMEGVAFSSPCGASEHVITMPIGLQPGRHRIDLIYNGGADRFVYFFDLIE